MYLQCDPSVDKLWFWCEQKTFFKALWWFRNPNSTLSCTLIFLDFYWGFSPAMFALCWHCPRSFRAPLPKAMWLQFVMPNANCLSHSLCQLGTAQLSCASPGQALSDMPRLENRANPSPAPCRITRAAEQSGKILLPQTEAIFRISVQHRAGFRELKTRCCYYIRSRFPATAFPPVSSVLNRFSCNWLKTLLQIIKKNPPVYLETLWKKNKFHTISTWDSEGGGNDDLYLPLLPFFNLSQKSQQRTVTQMLYSWIHFHQLSPIFTSCLSASPIYAVHLGLIDLVSFKLQLSMGKKKIKEKQEANHNRKNQAW